MSKLIVLTDLHFRDAGKTIIGLDPLARFDAVFANATDAHPDAEAVILMGDLTHSGLPSEYRLLRERLSGCPIPVALMLGNHDHRGTFREVFADAPQTPQGHVQQIIDLPDHRIITLDTNDVDADPPHSGRLCADRLAWLDAALADAGGRMPLVFTHHPPHDIGLPGMDAIRLVNGPDLLKRLAGTGAHLFCGHVHRTISGQAGGIPFTMFKSPCHQCPLDLVAADSSLSVAEPGAYGLLLLTANGVIAHSEDVGIDAPTISGAEALPEGRADTP